MTRDEAMNLVSREGLHHYSAPLVDSLAALGVLKLDKPKPDPEWIVIMGPQMAQPVYVQSAIEALQPVYVPIQSAIEAIQRAGYAVRKTVSDPWCECRDGKP